MDWISQGCRPILLVVVELRRCQGILDCSSRLWLRRCLSARLVDRARQVLVVLQLPVQVLTLHQLLVPMLVFVLVEVQILKVFWIWRVMFLLFVGSCQSLPVVQRIGMLVS